MPCKSAQTCLWRLILRMEQKTLAQIKIFPQGKFLQARCNTESLGQNVLGSISNSASSSQIYPGEFGTPVGSSFQTSKSRKVFNSWDIGQRKGRLTHRQCGCNGEMHWVLFPTWPQNQICLISCPGQALKFNICTRWDWLHVDIKFPCGYKISSTW